MTSWTVDVRHLAPGYYLGGNAGRVCVCSVCGLGAVRLSPTSRKDGLHERFAHVIELTLNPKLEPTAQYLERHIGRDPIAANVNATANDNGKPTP